MLTAETIRDPFGNPATVVLSASGDQDITISNARTILDGETNAGTADRTLNLTPATDLPAGSMVFVIHDTAGSFGIAGGTNVRQVATLGGSAGTYIIGYVFTGTTFDNCMGDQIA